MDRGVMICKRATSDIRPIRARSISSGMTMLPCCSVNPDAAVWQIFSNTKKSFRKQNSGRS